MEIAVHLAVAGNVYDGVFCAVLDKIWDLIESVSEGYLPTLVSSKIRDKCNNSDSDIVKFPLTFPVLPFGEVKFPTLFLVACMFNVRNKIRTAKLLQHDLPYHKLQKKEF